MRMNVLIITCLRIDKERVFILIFNNNNNNIIINYYYYYWTLRNYAKDGLNACEMSEYKNLRWIT
jgi:hypothetical protein